MKPRQNSSSLESNRDNKYFKFESGYTIYKELVVPEKRAGEPDGIMGRDNGL